MLKVSMYLFDDVHFTCLNYLFDRVLHQSYLFDDVLHLPGQISALAVFLANSVFGHFSLDVVSAGFHFFLHKKPG